MNSEIDSFSKYFYKVKGPVKPFYHRGGDFLHDADGTVAWGAQVYMNKILTNYEIMFGCKPK
jgi:hypothetical protein